MPRPFTNTRRLAARPLPAGLPMPRRDQDWWSTNERRLIPCSNCGRQVPDYATVMAYCAALDHFGHQAEMHPGWKEKGWLMLHECVDCDAQWYGATLDDAAVKELGEALGGWRTENMLGE